MTYQWIYFCALSSVPLVYVPVPVPVSLCFGDSNLIMSCKVREGGASSRVLVFQGYLGSSGFSSAAHKW